MSPIEVTVPWLPGWIDAVTLWPFIIYRRGYETNVPLRCHEMYHWRQALRWGVLPWYLAYLMLMPFYIGRPRRHPMEVPAYEVQREVRERMRGGLGPCFPWINPEWYDSELAETRAQGLEKGCAGKEGTPADRLREVPKSEVG